MLRHVLIALMVGMVVTLAGGQATAQSAPEGQLVIAFDTSIAPTYFDPAEAPGLQTPFVFHYALHDALVKPLPGNSSAPAVAASPAKSSTTTVTIDSRRFPVPRIGTPDSAHSRAGETAFLRPEDQARIAATPGLARVQFLRSQNLLLDPGRPPVILLAGLADGTGGLPLTGSSRAPSSHGPQSR